MKRILWILLIGVVVGCIIVYLLYGLRPEPQLEQKDEGRPQTTVYLQPYDNFTKKEGNQRDRFLIPRNGTAATV